MQPLPPGHSFAGAIVPALGGFLQRVRRDSDARELVARSADSDYPGDAAAQHLEAELEALLDTGANTSRAALRIDGQRQSWLLYETPAQLPLDASHPYALEEFWNIAKAITRALADGHRRGCVHGRLDANCIWWNPAQRHVHVLGMLPLPRAHLANLLPASIDTAPELLASERAPVSAAADVYSLGAVFYRLLSGRPPIVPRGNLAFEAAATPPDPLDPDGVPKPLADLIGRMLSKSPTSRPPDATCVLEELEVAERGGRALPPWSLDLTPRSLVGRRAELALLLDQARSVANGASTILRVEAEPGVGKSQLLAEFLRKVRTGSRLVAACKFEQFHQGRPYSALLTACGSALRHALGGEHSLFKHTQERLQQADPTLLAALVPEIPELRPVHGVLPDASSSAAESQSQFRRAFTELLSRLCSAETSPVLVLDDVQWADRDTADFLVELCRAVLPPHLLLVLAYRGTAARHNRDLAELLRVVDLSPVISLEPFTASETEKLCISLVPQCDGIDALAAVVHQRSQGNALHSIELVRNFLANGELARLAGRWQYVEEGRHLQNLSETVAELIRDRLAREPAATRRILAVAACVGHSFGETALAAATGESEPTLRELELAVHRGFLVRSTRNGEFRFCHDRIQQVARELASEDERRDVNLRLGRHYLAELARDHSVLFSCLDHLNPVRRALLEDEQRRLSLLNLEGARRARAAIAYERAIPLFKLYLENKHGSPEDRFDATLLLMECSFLSGGDNPREDNSPGTGATDQALAACAALATTKRQRLTLLRSQMTCYVHDYNYEGAVKAGLDALRLLGRPLPAQPPAAWAIARVVGLSLRMAREKPGLLAQRPDRSTEDDEETFRFLVGLWGPSFWTSPMLNVLLSVRLVEMALRCGNGPHSSMAYACFAAICHMQGRYETAIRYGRVASLLTTDRSPYTRAIVRFVNLTFFGLFEHPPGEVLRRYGLALKEAVAQGEIVAAPIIDGAVTTLPHTGVDIAQILSSLKDYEREARRMGARHSQEMIGVVRAWCEALGEGKPRAELREVRTDLLNAPLQNEEFVPHRDILRMQVEYLNGRDEEVLEIGSIVRRNMLMKGNPFCKAAYALYIVLASTRSRGRLTRTARESLKFLERLDSVTVIGEASPATLRPALRLAQGVMASLEGDSASVELLQAAVELAVQKGQGLIRAISLERLARLHGARNECALFLDRIREAAQAFHRFGAMAKVGLLVKEFPGVNWTHLHRQDDPAVGIQVEGIMRAATTIIEATSSDELGPTLLRVIATVAAAMRAFLFAYSDGNLVLVAGCERDRANLALHPTPVDSLDPERYAINAIRRAERALELIELPRDRSKFQDDPYLSGPTAPSALLCVPLLYRSELVAVLYLENNSNTTTFTAQEVTLVTLLGKQSAIAMANADNHRLQIEALQAKVNPHFLYNALTAIAALIERSPEQAEAAVYKLNRLYRYMVSSSAHICVPLEKELAVVRDYLELEQARFGKRVNVRWDVDSAATAFQVPALLIQPLAENAVKHGLARSIGGGTVTISAEVSGDTLLIAVSDNGPGWYEHGGGTKFGLKSIRRRLSLLYGERAELRIIRSNGVTVELAIPTGVKGAIGPSSVRTN